MNTANIRANIQPFQLVFTPIKEDTAYGPTCQLEFEFPVGTKDSYTLFLRPDGHAIRIDDTNEIVDIKVLTKNMYVDLPIDNLQCLNKEMINNDLFNLYFRCIVDLLIFYYRYNVSVGEMANLIALGIDGMKNYLMCNTHKRSTQNWLYVDIKKTIQMKGCLDHEISMISSTLTYNILHILSFLIPREVYRQIDVPVHLTFEN